MRKILALSLLSFVVGSQSAKADSIGIYGDSGITGPSYDVMLRHMEELASVHPELVSVIDYGETVEGRQLRMLKFAEPQSAARERLAVLISGATHGNEYLGIAYNLPDRFLAGRDALPGLDAFLRTGGILYVVPILNPDGYERDQRHNRNGVDLNRDFPLVPAGRDGFRQPETRQLVERLESELAATGARLAVSMDYHCCVGALMYPWAYTNRSIPTRDREAHAAIGAIMLQAFPRNYRYTTWISALGYYANGTSQDFYYAKHGTLAYTFEGRYGVEDEHLENHVAMWDGIFAMLAGSAR